MKQHNNHETLVQKFSWDSESSRYKKNSSGQINSAPFIKGPLPLDWMHRAGRLNGKSLHVALELYRLVGFHTDGSKTVELSNKQLAKFGVSRDTKYEALKRLREAGLIRIEQQSGRLPKITLLDCPLNLLE
nr:hypothetical protein [uncultured Undibacterium sp.]